MIIFLSGKDTFRSRQQLKKMIEKFKKDRDPAGYNVVALDAEKGEDAKRVMNELLSAPFLADRRLVVVENLLVSKERALQEEIRRRAEEKTLPESTVAVFWEGTDTFKIKEAKALAERLGKEKFSQAFEVLAGAKLAGWVAEEAAERGGKIAPSALQFLAAHGGDAWRLSTLIDQLIAYARNGSAAREITMADATLFVEERFDDNVFNLVDAIVAGQAKNAYRMIREQYRKGEEAQYLFAMLVRQFRILLELRDLFEREEAFVSDAAAKRLGLHPYVVKKSLPFVKRYTRAELERVYRALLDMDIAIKTGQQRGEDALDVFVAHICFSLSPTSGKR